MDRRQKAALHRDKAPRLNLQWKVGAAQARYHEHGYWYAKLSKFPAALFDSTGYVVFATEAEYLSSPHLLIGKQIGLQKPGISAIPGYVRMLDQDSSPGEDIDIHELSGTEGYRRLVLHLVRERDKGLAKRKKKSATSLKCEICGFSFSKAYGKVAEDYCEVHHLIPLSESDQVIKTRLKDLCILCANCHRVVHLRNPPYSLQEVRAIHEHACIERRGG